MSATASANWYDRVRATPVTHALSLALKMHVQDPWRLLAIAVVGQAYCDGEPVWEWWVDLADIDAERMGVQVLRW